MENGVQHYFVEVTSKDGLQYGLLAYGEEAIALYKETMKTLGKNIQWKEKIFNFLLFLIIIFY